jgi:hypothetical protein
MKWLTIVGILTLVLIFMVAGCQSSTSSSTPVPPGLAVMNASILEFNHSLALNAGETKIVDVTLNTRKDGPGKVTYTLFGVKSSSVTYASEGGVPIEDRIPLPQGLMPSIDPSSFMAYPDNVYHSMITIKTAPDLRAGTYLVFLDQNFEKFSMGGSIFSIKVNQVGAATDTTQVSLADSINDSVVQVGESADKPEAFGIAVGDGSLILTVIDWESRNPIELKVILPGGGIFNASVQALDSRSGATLLKLEDARLLPAITGDASALAASQKLFINEWNKSEGSFKLIPVLIDAVSPNLSPVGFNIRLANGLPVPNDPHSWANYQGSAILDEEGKVLGLESIMTHRLVQRTGYIGYIPPIVTINNALDLLSPESSQQLWANGPLLFSVIFKNGSYSSSYDGFVK